MTKLTTNDFVTTELAPATPFSPSQTPDMMTTLQPMKHIFPMLTSSPVAGVTLEKMIAAVSAMLKITSTQLK